MSLKRALVALCLVGCSCERLPEPPASVPPTEIEAPPVVTLPSTTADLPAATPALSITVSARSFELSNRALVESWPTMEREAVGRMRPLGDASYPVMAREVDDASDVLLVPGLREAVSEMRGPERARATLAHAEGITGVVAIRADADVHYARVVAALFAAGMNALDRPRLVLSSAGGERELRLAEHTRPEPVPGQIVAPRVQLAVRMTADGLDVRTADRRFAPGCATDATPGDTAAPTIERASMTPAAIERCLDAIGANTVVLFSASGALRYGDVVDVLVAIAHQHELSLATTIE